MFRLREFAGWIGIRDGRFVYVEEGAPPAGVVARERLDLGGRLIVPGLIDSHMHIESSLATPRRFAEAVVPHGTTAVLADSHEVANVAGEEGVRWMIRASQGLPLRVFTAIPSCVPATSPEIEWTAAVFDAGTVRRLAGEPTVIALGEVMDYGQVLGRRRTPAGHGAGRARGRVARRRARPGLARDRSVALPVLAHHLGSHHHDAGEDSRANLKGVAVMLTARSCTPENIAAVNALARSLAHPARHG